MDHAYGLLTDFFGKQGWNYIQSSQWPAIQVNITSESGRWTCLAIVEEKSEYITFISRFPSRALGRRVSACAELIARINFVLRMGAFSMNYEDGEICFRTCLPIAPAEATSAMIERLVLVNLRIVDHFYGPIMRVLHGGVSPSEALAKAKEKETENPEPRFDLN